MSRFDLVVGCRMCARFTDFRVQVNRRDPLIVTEVLAWEQWLHAFEKSRERCRLVGLEADGDLTVPYRHTRYKALPCYHRGDGDYLGEKISV